MRFSSDSVRKRSTSLSHACLMGRVSLEVPKRPIGGFFKLFIEKAFLLTEVQCLANAYPSYFFGLPRKFEGKCL